MKKLLRQIFSSKIEFGRFIVSGLGLVLGLAIVLLSLNTYLKLDHYFESSQNNNFLVVNKEVKGINLSANTSFTEEEIEEMNAQPFVKRVGEVSYNEFKVVIENRLMPRAEIFMEAVPDEYIDVELPLSWRRYKRDWDAEEDFVPMIIGSEFLKLYNFGFAASNGTPQLTNSLAQSVDWKMMIKGTSGKKYYNARVVGISDRFQTVLVPQTFLKWANAEVAGITNSSKPRLVVEVNQKSDPTLGKFLSERGIEVEEDKINLQESLAKLYIMVSVIAVFGILFIFISLALVTTNFSLMVSNAQEEIKLLIQLGYTRKDVSSVLLKYFTKFVFVCVLISLGIFAVGDLMITEFAINNGFDFKEYIPNHVFTFFAGVLIVIVGIVWWSIKKAVSKS